MIRICSVDLDEEIDDIKLFKNIKCKELESKEIAIIGVMLKEDSNETIINQLKEFNTYYYENNPKKLKRYLKNNEIKSIMIAINLNNIKCKKDIKQYIKILKQIGKTCRKNKIEIGIKETLENKNKLKIIDELEEERISCLIFNYREDINIEKITIQDLIDSIKIEIFKNKKDKYNYIYEKTCKILDNEFYAKNLCEFKNNRCIEKRNSNYICGCCRHYKNIFSKQLIKCEYLINKRCKAKCISCKMFTCSSLEKKGIKFKISDFYLISNYFNVIQKLIVKYSYYTPKEKIIKRLLKF